MLLLLRYNSRNTRVMSGTLWHTTTQCVARVEKPCAQSKEMSDGEIVLEHSFLWFIVFYSCYQRTQTLQNGTNRTTIVHLFVQVGSSKVQVTYKYRTSIHCCQSTSLYAIA